MREEAPADSTAFEWVKAVCSAFGVGSGFCQAIWFIILQSTKRSELVFHVRLDSDGTRDVRFEWTSVSWQP